MKPSNIVIIIIDDNFAFNDPLVIKLKEDFKDVQVLVPQKGLSYIKENLAQNIVILLDIKMPYHLNGHQVLNEIRKISFNIPVLIFSAVEEEKETFSDFLNNKAIGFIKKDSNYKDIIKKVHQVVETELIHNVDNVLEKWIEKQDEEMKNKPFLTIPGDKTYSLKDLLIEIRQQTEVGKKMQSNVTRLAIDLLGRNKKEIE